MNLNIISKARKHMSTRRMCSCKNSAELIFCRQKPEVIPLGRYCRKLRKKVKI